MAVHHWLWYPCQDRLSGHIVPGEGRRVRVARSQGSQRETTYSPMGRGGRSQYLWQPQLPVPVFTPPAVPAATAGSRAVVLVKAVGAVPAEGRFQLVPAHERPRGLTSQHGGVLVSLEGALAGMVPTSPPLGPPQPSGPPVASTMWGILMAKEGYEA